MAPRLPQPPAGMSHRIRLWADPDHLRDKLNVATYLEVLVQRLGMRKLAGPLVYEVREEILGQVPVPVADTEDAPPAEQGAVAGVAADGSPQPD